MHIKPINLILTFTLTFSNSSPIISQENFVRTEEFLEATSDADALVRKRVTTVYYDGLRRERWRVVGIGEQVVSTCDEQAGPASAVTSRTDYDGRGNVWRQWLPVPGDVRTTRRYRGSLEMVSGAESYTRVNTSTGYYDCKEKRHYYYLTNRQGSVMAVIDDQGTTVQRTGLYPSGTPFILPGDYNSTAVNATYTAATTPLTLTPTTDRLHIGNRWLGHSGLNRYDNTARLHDPLLLRFDTPDPLATKFPALNPWTHTAANPANAIDPDGFAQIFTNNNGFLEWIGSDGEDDELIAIADNKLSKQILKLTEQGLYYKGGISNSKHMAVIPSLKDLIYISSSINIANNLEVETGASKDKDGYIQTWDNGNKVTTEIINGEEQVVHSIEAFVQNGKHIPNAQFSEWSFHVHSIVSLYPNGGLAIPSDADKTFDNKLRKAYGYNGSTFVIGGKDGNICFYNGWNVISTCSYSNLLTTVLCNSLFYNLFKHKY